MNKRARNRKNRITYANATGVGACRRLTVKNSGYGDLAASRHRQEFANFRSSSQSPNRDITDHAATLRSRSRSLYMQAPLATAACKTMRTSIVGQGLHLHVMPDFETLGMTREAAAAWGKEVENEFAIWAENKAADVLGLSDFYELQQLVCLSWKMSGDVFCLFRYDGKPTLANPYPLRLNVLEADRISTPANINVSGFGKDGQTENGNSVFDGVEINKKTGAVEAYYIADDYSANSPNITWQRVPARGKETGMPNVLHILDAERPEQVRGVPFITHVMAPIMQLKRYLSAEQIAALMETYLSGYITTENADAPLVGNQVVSEEEEEDGEGNKVLRDLAELEPEPGSIHQLLPGEDIKFNDPKRPGTQFPHFVEAIAKQIGAALEIPVDVLMKSYNSSYSASRAAMVDFWRVIKMNRDWFAGDFCAAVYAEWLSLAVSMGRISAPGFFTDPRRRKAWLGHEWNGSAMPQIDPVKEAEAKQIMVANGFQTYQQATTELNGGDWNKNSAELAQEVERLAIIKTMLSIAAGTIQQYQLEKE